MNPNSQRSRWHVLIVVLVSCVLVAGAPRTHGQGSQADYARAKQLARDVVNKVYRDKVKPVWLPGGERCWYRVTTGAQTHEFVLVDAATGKRGPAFDHERMAAALGVAGGNKVTAGKLPVDKLEFAADGSSVVFRAGGKWWRCALATYTLTPETHIDDTVRLNAPAGGPRRSVNGGASVQLKFHNATTAEVKLFWLTTDGEREAFGTIAAGDTHEQQTFAGHAWLVTDGTNKSLGGLRAPDDDVVIEIDGQFAARPERQSRRPSADLSPDGRRQAFFRDSNLYVRDTITKEEFALSTNDVSGNAYGGRVAWSPDSKNLVVFRTQAGGDRKVTIVESSPKDQLQPKLVTYDYLKPGDPIPQPMPCLFNVPQRRAVPIDETLCSNPWSNDRVEWSPDSKSFTFVHNQRGHQLLRVLAVDAETGATRAVVEEKSSTFIDYSQKFFLHRLNGGKELIWASERDGWNHYYLYDLTTGTVKNQITRGNWLVDRVEFIDEEKKQIWFVALGIRPGQDPYHAHHCRINFDGTGLVILTAGDGTHEVEYSPDRRFFVDRWSRVDQPAVTELRRAVDGALICEMERGDWSALLKTGWTAPERFSAQGRDGKTDIYGIIIRPSNFDPAKKYPVLEHIYAGPHDAFVPKKFGAWFEMNAMSELGFIVVKMDGMGTNWRERSFHDVCWKNLQDGGFPDRIAWIKAAGAKHPEMDLNRVGIYGGSAGGQNALAGLLHHGDFYQAGVADCGCHDNRMDKVWWNEAWMGWPVDASYAENSNVTHAGKLQGKLMLVVGELDRNVDPATTMQVANALEKADKDFDLVIVTGAGHGAAETPYGSRRRADFFVRHLLGREPRWK